MLIALLTLIIILGIVLISFAYIKDEKNIIKDDGKVVKEEYEKLNNIVNENNQKTYPTVNIREDNVFKKTSEDEIVDIIKNQTAVIFFGFNTCPWCRNLINVLDEAAKQTNIAKIYYLDVLDIRDELELDEDNNVIVKKQGTSAYYQILELLHDQLDDYTLKNKNNEQINTNEKRLYSPTVVTVKNGKILKIHVGTVSSQKDAYAPLKENEKQELLNILTQMIEEITSPTCENNC